MGAAPRPSRLAHWLASASPTARPTALTARAFLIPKEAEAEILRHCHAEQWRIGTVAKQLGLHHTTVHKPVLLSNKAFSEWSEVFPHAACVVTLVDRLIHRAEVVDLEPDSYRLEEAKELTLASTKQPSKKPPS